MQYSPPSCPIFYDQGWSWFFFCHGYIAAVYAAERRNNYVEYGYQDTHSLWALSIPIQYNWYVWCLKISNVGGSASRRRAIIYNSEKYSTNILNAVQTTYAYEYHHRWPIPEKRQPKYNQTNPFVRWSPILVGVIDVRPPNIHAVTFLCCFEHDWIEDGWTSL